MSGSKHPSGGSDWESAHYEHDVHPDPTAMARSKSEPTTPAAPVDGPTEVEWMMACNEIGGPDVAEEIITRAYSIAELPRSSVVARGLDPADPWRGLYAAELMPKLDGVNDYHAAHPDLPEWPDDEERSIGPLISAQGFAYHAINDEYPWDEGEPGEEFDTCAWLANWKPEPPAGEHWRLVMVHDTEDGPAAVFVRPLGLVDASPKERAFLQTAEGLEFDAPMDAVVQTASPCGGGDTVNHAAAALAHLSNALDDLQYSPDQRPVPLIREAMWHVQQVQATSTEADT